MKFKSFFKFILCLCLGISFLLSIHNGEINRLYADDTCSAKAMCVMEKESGRVLYQKNMNQKLAMASTTKIMTAITAIKNCNDLDEVFEIDNACVGISGTSIYLKKGEKLSMRELLYGLMLVSGNDASVAIACRVSGSEEAFIKLMNEEAKKMGAESTHFENPHGLDSKEHYTSAHDLALITAHALKNQTFAKLVSTKNMKISGSVDDEVRYLKNKNRLLNEFDGSDGVKTGFTNNAGRCLVSSATRKGMTVVCVVLNCGPMFEECERLMNLAFENFGNFELLEPYHYIKEVSVSNGEKENVKVYSVKGFSYPLTKDEFLHVNYYHDLPATIEAPVVHDEEVGKIEIYLKNELLFSEKIYTMEEIKSIKLPSKIKEIFENWI